MFSLLHAARLHVHRRSRRLALACVLTLLGAAAPASAQVDIPNRRGGFTPGELALLPPYCADMQGMPTYEKVRGNYWRGLMGSDFQHIHHYCRGLRDVYFARTHIVSRQHRLFLWERAIDEYNYMIRNSKPTMPLMPEFFLRRGEAQMQLGKVGEAEQSFEKAREIKPNYAPAYIAWADYLVRVKQNARAEELLLQGLAAAPADAELRARLTKLTGREPPLPAPPVAAPAAAAASAAPASASAPAPASASAPAADAPASAASAPR